MDLIRLAAADSEANETSRAVVHVPVNKMIGVETRPAREALAVEEPLEIRLVHGPSHRRATKAISVTMRTPGYDYELAAGFLMTEGVVHDALDIQRIVYAVEASRPAETAEGSDGDWFYQPRRNIVQVELAPDVSVSLANLERNFYTTSSCGVCGKASLLALRTVCPPRMKNTFSIDAEVLYTLPARLREAQSVFDRTGGLHGAGLFDAEGTLLAMREDVGRHNAVDKLLGGQFLEDRTPLHDRLLLLSGRASFELLQKAVMGGISVVAAIGAPSSLAVWVAQEFDVTLAGFLRDGHMNIYHGADRIRRETPSRKEVQA
ncbi:MAG: formate dehydrogenase accessory sulfurtransferase FdhD [Acidobacteriaceae bacterium]